MNILQWCALHCTVHSNCFTVIVWWKKWLANTARNSIIGHCKFHLLDALIPHFYYPHKSFIKNKEVPVHIVCYSDMKKRALWSRYSVLDLCGIFCLYASQVESLWSFAEHFNCNNGQSDLKIDLVTAVSMYACFIQLLKTCRLSDPPFVLLQAATSCYQVFLLFKTF